MAAKMFGTAYENATGDETVLPPAGGAPEVSKESYLTGLVNHVKENKIVYFALVAVGAWIVYKKFIKK
jgi:hypothetical protein